MRKQTLLRVRSTQDVCIFCASRLRGEAASSITRAPQRRQLNSSSRAPQAPGYAEAYRQDNELPQPPPASGSSASSEGFGGRGWGKMRKTTNVDHESTLTPEEQRVKEQRMNALLQQNAAARQAPQQSQLRQAPAQSGRPGREGYRARQPLPFGTPPQAQDTSGSRMPATPDERTGQDQRGSRRFRFQTVRSQNPERFNKENSNGTRRDLPDATQADAGRFTFGRSIPGGRRASAEKRIARPSQTSVPDQSGPPESRVRNDASAQISERFDTTSADMVQEIQTSEDKAPAARTSSWGRLNATKPSETKSGWGGLLDSEPNSSAIAEGAMTASARLEDDYDDVAQPRKFRRSLDGNSEPTLDRTVQPRLRIRFHTGKGSGSKDAYATDGDGAGRWGNSQWSQLKRRTTSSEADAANEVQDFLPIQEPRVDPEYARASLLREQQAKSGAFVRLTAVCGRCGKPGHSVEDCSAHATRRLDLSRIQREQDVVNPTQKDQEILPTETSNVAAPSEDAPPAAIAQGNLSTEVIKKASEPDWEEEDSVVQGSRKAIRSPKFAEGTQKTRGRNADRRHERHTEEEDDRDEGFDYDDDFDDASAAKRRKQRKKERREKLEKQRAARVAAPAGPTPIFLPEFISVTNLASALRVRMEDFVRKMEELGFEDIHYDHVLNAENAGLIAMEYNYEPITDNASEDKDLHAQPEPEDKHLLPQRPPVVTIMGHVDHGKTTILDFLRKSSVAATEHGGITQHIGAFSVPLSSGKTITFLDTPGHAAFLSMRQRGANVTDMVILVVAADDSVKPQTIEAIKHAQGARVPIIVAINKIDKEDADPERVKQDLARHGVDVEDFGGETQVVCVSGKTGQGMRELEEAAVTLSEVLDHRAPTDGPVEGWVLEATTRKAGRVATVLVRRGTLRPGDILVAGATWTRVRTLKNEAGVAVDAVGPGMPVEVDGWRAQPAAGDEALQAPSEQKASDVVDFRAEKEGSARLAKDMEAINDARRLEQERREREGAAAAEGADGADALDAAVAAAGEAGRDASGVQEVFLIVKADVSGSSEAVVDAVSALGNAEVRPHILRSGVGPIAEFDVEHAAAAKGHIVNFNVPMEPKMVALAESMGVRILDNNVIYRLVDQVRAVLSERLAPTVVQRVTGEADVAQKFSIGIGGRKTMTIAGVKVRNGTVARESKARVLRDGKVIYDGILSSLKNQKKDVAEMRKGTECGVGFENWDAFEVGDQIQCYEEKVEKRTL